MLSVFSRSITGLAPAEDPKAALASGDFVWADLHAPGDSPELSEWERLVEAALRLDVPTPAERRALEQSARFYEERGALFLSVTLMGQRAEGAFVADAVSFILAGGRLVSVRTINPRAFATGEARASARIARLSDGAGVLMALLEGVVERASDVLAETMREARALSAMVFVLDERSNLRAVLRDLGRLGALTSLAHESLSSLHRMTAHVGEIGERHALPPERMRALARDVQELERQAEALQSHLSFLMDAALGLVGAAQNNALRTLALITTAFAPATLVASIFGMNFQAMDWFQKGFGPWAAFALMLAAPAALLGLARWRRWF